MSFSSAARLTDVRVRRSRAQKSILSAGRVEINFSSFRDTLFNIFLYPSSKFEGIYNVVVFPVEAFLWDRMDQGRIWVAICKVARQEGNDERRARRGNEWQEAHFLPHL